MIKAALHGKLDCIDREDPLTGSVFGHLRYLSPRVMREWLSQAQPGNGPAHELKTLWASLPELTDMHFWPRMEDTVKQKGWVEPDLLLEFNRTAVIVEAKLRSGKSGATMLNPEGEAEPVDQLARQWRSTVDFYHRHQPGRVEVVALLYITAHLSVPVDDVTSSTEEILKLGLRAPPIYWLPWSALVPILENEVQQGQHPACLIAEDLLAYLRQAAVSRFRGWRVGEVAQEGLGWRYAAAIRPPYWQKVGEVPDACWTYQKPRSGYFKSLAAPGPTAVDDVWRYRAQRKETT
ncbi:hypothetical protein ACN469_36255 [Corallococcus terminator]